jgi:CHAT domain-containing protein/tetratricopeptide (TPR) repeat protein
VSSPRGAFAVGDLLALPGDADLLAHLRAENLADEQGLGWVLDRAEECVHDDPSAAATLAGLCGSAGRQLGLPGVGARAAYLEARVRAEQGELTGALDLIEEAQRLWRRAGQPLQAARTDLGRMQILDDLGQHATALEVGSALVAELDRLPAEPGSEELRQWVRAAALENTGVAAGFTGDHERALLAYQAAEEAYRALDLPEETARPQANRGIELVELGRTGEALEVLRTAEAAFRAAGDRMWSAKCAGHLAGVLELRGELHEALRLLEPARRTLEELGAGVEAVRLRLAGARVYLAVGLTAEARTEASAAEEEALGLGLLHDAAHARFLGALAQAGDGDLGTAERTLRGATDLFREVGDRQYAARALLAAADLAAAGSRPEEAYPLAVRAAAALTAGGWLIPLAWAELRCFDTAGTATAAAPHLERAVELATELQIPQLRYECDLRTARQQRRRGAAAPAEELLRTAVRRVEQARAVLPDPQLRRSFAAERLAAHDELIDLLTERGHDRDVREALAIADRSKSQTLAELRARTVGAHGVPSRAEASEGGGDEQLRRLEGDLQAVYAGLLSAEPAQVAVLQRRAADLERRISARRVRSTVDVGPSRAVEPGLPVAAPTGRAGDVALEFHVLDEDVLVFVVRAGAVEVRRLASVLPSVTAQLDRLSAQWVRFRMGAAFARRHLAALTDTAREILGALHTLLIAPIEPLLVERPTERLVVVPHRLLHAVPFHALFDGQRYLVERWVVTVSPGLSGDGADPGPRSRERDALVLAVPDAHAPAVAREAEALGALLPRVRVLLGEAATTEVLRASVPGPALLHIACHGLYRPGNPLFSSLRLGDRWLTAAEVLDLDLGGALVTLSACESGRGGATAEPVGLGWAFLSAGASGVTVSQWVVHDDVTAELMTQTYRLLADGMDSGMALCFAQRKIVNQVHHPYYWAPFAHVSPGRGLEWEGPHAQTVPS